MPVANDIDNYLADQPAEIKSVLEELRTTIKEAAPEAEEALVYSLPAYKYKGHLVGFAVQKKHLSFFTMSPELAEAMKAEITKTHKLSGATIHFSADKPLAKGLVKKIVKARIEENERKSRK